MGDLTESEETVLGMLATWKSPYVRRALLDAVGGRGTLESLGRRMLVVTWSAMAVEEKEYHDKRKAWIDKRARRVEFAALTPLGMSVTSRDVFQSGDTGQPYLDRRLIGEKGEWMLQSDPIRTRGGGPSIRQLCPDVVKEEKDRARHPKPGRRGG